MERAQLLSRERNDGFSERPSPTVDLSEYSTLSWTALPGSNETLPNSLFFTGLPYERELTAAVELNLTNSAEVDERGIDEKQLVELIDRLAAAGYDVSVLNELRKDFEYQDVDKNGFISRKEADRFFSHHIGLSASFANRDPGQYLEAARRQAETIAAAGMGGEYLGSLAKDSFEKMSTWLKENPGSTPQSWGYDHFGLALGRSLRERMDAGLDHQEMKELVELIPVFSDNFVPRGISFGLFPQHLKATLEAALNGAAKVDTNGDGKVDPKEILYHLAGGVDGKPPLLTESNLWRLSVGIMNGIPNPEWPFFEDLEGRTLFGAADTTHDGIIDEKEMNEYFKLSVWTKFNFSKRSSQRGPQDVLDLERLEWQYQSADCFALAGVGGKASAELVRDTLKGIEDSWAKYARPAGAPQSKDVLTMGEYREALKNEFTVALLERLKSGVSYENLKDYADLAANLTKELQIADRGFHMLVSEIQRAAANARNYDCNSDGVVTADELWSGTQRDTAPRSVS